MPGGSKCIFTSDSVLDSAQKDWLQVELRNAVKSASAVFHREQKRLEKEKKKKEKHGAHWVDVGFFELIID